jgi:hypothetical protein
MWHVHRAASPIFQEQERIMYSFLILLPLTLITATIGVLLIFSPQAADYVDYIASLEGQPDVGSLALQIPLHIASYAIVCFVLVATTHTISAPVSDHRSVILKRLRLALEAIFVAVPSVIIVLLATYTNVYRAARAANALADNANIGLPAALSWTAVGIAIAGLVAIVFADRRRDPRLLRLALVVVVAGIPIVLAVGLLVVALTSDSKQVSWLLEFAAVSGALGLAASVAAVVLVEPPLKLFESSLRPLAITAVDMIAGLALAAYLALAVSLKLWPAEVATFLGMFPVLFMASAAGLLVIALVFAQRSSPVAILSVATSLVVVFHVVDGVLAVHEFRYRSVIPADVKPNANGRFEIGDVEKQRREIPELRDAFRDWLNTRRSAIERYRANGKTYPVIVFAAQGGGIYAAYHSALSLARLYDRCPEFANHVFAVSAVSGGALGSAVFAELVRSVPDGLRNKPAESSGTCIALPEEQKLEARVKKFFATDFLSPVVDSAMVSDIPSLMLPWLRFGRDRAYALEYAFENAYENAFKLGGSAAGGPPSHGLKADFYGRWTPDGPAPALFLAATGANFGLPVVISQIRRPTDARLLLRRLVAAKAADELAGLLENAPERSERQKRMPIANILNFRPDLQLATSTAVALSARFPYVTPPANIRRNEKIEKPTELYQNIRVLELLDGGMFENSGGLVAVDIISDLQSTLRYPQLVNDFKDDISFHLVRFTDNPGQRVGNAAETQHFEILAPLLALNTIRVARGAQLPGSGNFGQGHFYLADPWFAPPLNWLLSQETKTNIELRSGAEIEDRNKLCCKVVMFSRTLHRHLGDFLLNADWEDLKGVGSTLSAELFDPSNKKAFDGLLSLVVEGDERKVEAATK